MHKERLTLGIFNFWGEEGPQFSYMCNCLFFMPSVESELIEMVDVMGSYI